MRVHLLRHGETEGGTRYWGGIDVALSWKGWRQMRVAVAGQSWDLIVSSPLRRCAAFAEALARQLGVRCRYEVDLREMSFGEWEGRSAVELLETDGERLRYFWVDPKAHPPPGGESLVQLHARVMAAWQRVVNDPDSGRVLIVTHGGPIRVLRAMQSGLALSALLSIDVPHAALVSIESPPDRGGTPEPPPKSSPCAERETPA
jgi:alpha-ribazole phosphatase